VELLLNTPLALVRYEGAWQIKAVQAQNETRVRAVIREVTVHYENIIKR